MSEIIPFRGYFYNQGKISSIMDVLAPPYDVISPKDQERYFRLSPFNIIHLILGKETPSDTPQNNKYTRAAGYLSDWIENGILERNSSPSFYVVRQEYLSLAEGIKRVRIGFIALLRLEAYEKRTILPHEDTLKEPKEDRLNLLKTCQANLCPIFGLFSDAQRKISLYLESGREETLFDFVDEAGIKYTLWALKDPLIVKNIKEMIGNEQIIIADGHHRYEASLLYKKSLEKEGKAKGNNDPSDYCMAYLTNLYDEGLQIEPLHRIILRLDSEKTRNLEERLKEYFSLQKFQVIGGNERKIRERLIKYIPEGKKKGIHRFGLYDRNRAVYYLLDLKDERIMNNLGDRKIHPKLQGLDVTILESLILNKVFDIDLDKEENQNSAYYHPWIDESLDMAKEKEYPFVILLNPPTIGEIREVALSNQRMPQKSTFFYPKILSGLVINKW